MTQGCSYPASVPALTSHILYSMPPTFRLLHRFVVLHLHIILCLTLFAQMFSHQHLFCMQYEWAFLRRPSIFKQVLGCWMHKLCMFFHTDYNAPCCWSKSLLQSATKYFWFQYFYTRGLSSPTALPPKLTLALHLLQLLLQQTRFQG